MVFSSIVFLLYFLPLVIITYYCLPHKIKNLFLLIASAVFYAWGAPKFIFVILTTTLFDFFIVQAIDKQQNRKVKKVLFVLSILVNTGLLYYFKYSNFFIDNINYVTGHFGMAPMPLLNIVLPIGISFYTFESLTYVVDVYLGKHKPLKKFIDMYRHSTKDPKSMNSNV